MRLLALAISILAFTPFLWIWQLSSDLIRPDRRAIQDYHLEWLKTPQKHGIRVFAQMCAKAETPCLFVEPDAAAGSAKRGKILRQQLSNEKIELLPYGETKGILVLLHGRNGRKEDLLPVAERFAAAGFKCVLPDMPAHGDNPQVFLSYATADHEKGFANKVLDDARLFYQDTSSKAGLWGMSMGGAFAIESAAAAPENWQALIIVASFDSLSDVIHDQLAPYPAITHQPFNAISSKLLKLQNQFDPEKSQPARWAKNIDSPVLVAHGTADELISHQRGKNLYHAFPGQNNHWISIPEATHKNILVTSYPLYKAMSTWYLQHM